MREQASVQDRAEEVREHLVSIRGGAPFLSPEDSFLLLKWLEEGISVAAIACAIERAAAKRRAARRRAALSLRDAKRHLKRYDSGKLRAKRSESTPMSAHPLESTIAALEHRDESTAQDLAATLRALGQPDSDALGRAALAAIRRYHTARWEHLDEVSRAALLADAAEELDYLRGMVSAPELERLQEEVARETLRSAHPELEASTIWEQLHA